MTRIAALGRIYKLIKLTRLIRIFKVFKNRNKFLKYAQETLQLNQGVEKLFFFIVILVLSLHIFTCLWVFFASLQGYKGTWMDPDYLNFSGPEQYLVSLYFMMTSFTTVGYGDIH